MRRRRRKRCPPEHGWTYRVSDVLPTHPRRTPDAVRQRRSTSWERRRSTGIPQRRSRGFPAARRGPQRLLHDVRAVADRDAVRRRPHCLGDYDRAVGAAATMPRQGAALPTMAHCRHLAAGRLPTFGSASPKLRCRSCADLRTVPSGLRTAGVRPPRGGPMATTAPSPGG